MLLKKHVKKNSTVFLYILIGLVFYKLYKDRKNPISSTVICTQVAAPEPLENPNSSQLPNFDPNVNSALGMAVYDQFGIKLVINQNQKQQLEVAIDLKATCSYDGSSFCLLLPTSQCSLPLNQKRMINTTAPEFRKEKIFLLGRRPGDVEGKQVLFPRYPDFFSWIYQGYLAQFRRDIIFKKELLELADKVLKNVLRDNNCSRADEGNAVRSSDVICTLVAVHLRMGDYDERLIRLGRDASIIQNSTYIPNCFKYVTDKYTNPIFLITGHTEEEVSQYLLSLYNFSVKGFRIVQMSAARSKLITKYENPGPGIDMLIISMADVVVQTYGSFGDMGAILGRDKKEVLFPRGHKDHYEKYFGNKLLPGYTPIRWNRLP
ncbi:uncharacterized protein LOC142348787 isoform X2 [Convolutriloba macropyga]|uniref:uncharacterized protein LOC142348787 isoform X2 n=1 Tax=Convolutriloba macropyga TaxID=536237 RepID=UPI003F51B51B